MMARYVFIAVLVGFAGRASACAVCFGDPGSDQTRALMIAMTVLLGLVVFMLATIVVVAVRISRRSVLVNEPELIDDGVEG